VIGGQQGTVGQTRLRQAETIEIHQARAGQDAFHRGAAMAGAQEGQQAVLFRADGGEADVSALRGQRSVMVAVPDAQADAQPGAGAQGDPGRAGHRLAFLERREQVRRQAVQAPAHGGEIVDQQRPGKTQAGRQGLGIHRPVQVGEADTAPVRGAGDGQAAGFATVVPAARKCRQDGFQAGMFRVAIAADPLQFDASAFGPGDGQAAVGAADIAAQNPHDQRRRSASGSAPRSQWSRLSLPGPDRMRGRNMTR
jgi:hypothetical protein